LLAETHGRALEEMRLQVLETRIEADLRLGHDREVIPELQLLVSAHLLRERPYALLIRAFYGTGQRSAALAAYRTVRDNLVAELACEPGPMLHALHQHILRSDADIPWAWPGDRARQLRLSLSLIG
jgi:DNA-binding SARP family transcriptional activator